MEILINADFLVFQRVFQKVVYKKYIWVNGKRYGPYLYHNKRVGDRVITSYHGPSHKKKSDRSVLYSYLVLVLVLAAAVFFVGQIREGVFYSPEPSISLSQDVFNAGDLVSGGFSMFEEIGKPIVEGSEFVINFDGVESRFALSELASPTVFNFKLKVSGTVEKSGPILREKPAEGGGGGGIEEPAEEEVVKKPEVPVEEVPVEEVPVEEVPVEEVPVEGGASIGDSAGAAGTEGEGSTVPDSGSGDSSSSIGDSGAGDSGGSDGSGDSSAGDSGDSGEISDSGGGEAPALSPSSEQVGNEVIKKEVKSKIVSGSVKQGGVFEYKFEENWEESVEIVSVEANGVEIDKDLLDLAVDGKGASVSTDYFGEIEVELDQFNLVVPEGGSSLEIKIVSDSGVLYEAQADVPVEVAEENVTNETITNDTTINETIVNETIINETVVNNTSVNATVPNVTIVNETVINITQYTAVLGQPVQFSLTVDRTIPLNEQENFVVQVPEIAAGITITKFAESGKGGVGGLGTGSNIKTGSSAPNTTDNQTIGGVNGTDNSSNAGFGGLVTGRVITSQEKVGGGIIEWFKKLFRATGFVASVPANNEQIPKKDVAFTLAPGEISADIKYTVPGPSVAYKTDTSFGEILGVESAVHLSDVLIPNIAIREIRRVGEEGMVQIYWVEGDVWISPLEIVDTNGNGFLDSASWVVPHLSNQTFEIILVTKAEHLDGNRSFISNIYDDVKELDGNWSETIPDGDYVRVMFARKLNSSNDITIYPRAVNGTPRIEVYEGSGSLLIASFDSLIDNEYNKILLTNLLGEQQVFDLLVLGGDVEFDHILDPPWWNPAWGRRREINITNAGLIALTDFPAYLNVSKEVLMQNDFDDVRFINGSCAGGSTLELDYEIESYTTTKADVWVRIPALLAGNTFVCMYYDNLIVMSGENASGVWDSGHVVVQHLEETSGEHNDSTQYGNNGTASGNVNQDGLGVVDGADEFNGGDVSVLDSDSLNLSNEFTLSAWVNVTSLPRNSMRILGKGAVNTTHANISLNVDDTLFFGGAISDGSGSAVGSGDFNNDGIDDLIIGAKTAGAGAGESYIFYGPLNNSGEFNASNNANVTFNGSASSQSGSAVGSGDFNNDGFDDLIIGAPEDSSLYGKAYVLYGPLNNSGEFNAPNNANVSFIGDASGDRLGSAVGSGDFNNDGFDDLILGARLAEGLGGSGASAGESYIFYGPLNNSGEFNALNNANVSFFGINGGESGSAVGSGDFNNDGIDDVVIGAPSVVHSISKEGESYILYGPFDINGQIVDLSLDANVTFYGSGFFYFAGSAVGSGDFNNDGIDDLILGEIGAPVSFGYIGETHIFYGPLYDSSQDIITTDANITFIGRDSSDKSGSAVGSGDFNNDGIDDVVIGAPEAEGAGGTTNNEGETYLLYGSHQLISNYDLMINRKGKAVGSFTDSSMKGSAVQSSSSLVLGQFNYIASTYDGSSLKMYVNGEESSSVATSKVLNVNAFDLFLGSFNGVSSYFNGTIDEVRVENVSRSADWINQSYQMMKNNFVDVGPEVSLDMTPPNITFGYNTAPAGTQTNNNTFVNLSTADNRGEHYAFTDFDRSLVLWMRMDDVNASGDPTDLSSYSNNGTKNGNPVINDSGYWGKSFDFDGAGDYITTPLNIDQSSGKTLTMCAWAYPNSISTGNHHLVSTDNGGFDWAINRNGATWSVAVGNEYWDTSISSDVNTWQHICVVFDTNDVIFYKNRTPLSEGVSPLYDTSDNNLTIGRNPGFSEFFNGSIDDVLIFNRSLSADEISALYNATANQYFNNFTNLTDGLHKFTGYAVDKAGNRNQTEERQVTIDSGLTSCGTLDVAGKVYTLQNDIPGLTGTCFTIAADNVTLDGNGKTITGLAGAVQGINNSIPIRNSTIKNLTIIGFNMGIQIADINDSLITNVNISDNPFSGSGIYLTGGINDKFIDNYINKRRYAVIFTGNSKGNLFQGNSIISSNLDGIRVIDSSENIFLNNIVEGSNGNAIYLGRSSSSPKDNNFTNITISGTNALKYDVRFNDAGINGNYFIDMPHIGNYSFAGAGSMVYFKNTTAGEIKFLEPINGTGTNLTNDVRISNNSVVVESSINSGLNKSANITLYGIGERGFIEPKILRDGLNCPASICTNFTALNVSNVKIGVTGWTGYSIGENFVVTQCGTLDVAGKVYTQTADIVPLVSPCINVTNENITFNGNGFWISNTSLNGTGIYSNQKNTTIINANVSMKYPPPSYGVKLGSSADNSYIYNNTLNGQHFGLYLFSGVSNASIISNRVNNNYFGIYLLTSNNNNLMGNTAKSNQYGILLVSSSNNNTLQNNTANNNYYGIYLSSSSNNNLTQNTANNNINYGIHLSSSSNNFFLNNTIITSKANSEGIYLYSNSDFNLIVNNTINTTQGDSIKLESTSGSYPENNNFTSNTIIDNGQLQLNFLSESINGTYLIDQPILNYSFTGVGGIVNFKNTTAGEIRFLEAINGSSESLSDDVRISNNSVVVESSINSGLNKSANITLYNIGERGFVEPMILRDGLNCPASICTNLTALNIPNVRFNVTGWTNYSIGSFVDSPPNINFTAPTPGNGTNQSNKNIFVNVTSSDDGGEHYTFLDFDRSLVLWLRMDDVNGSGDPTDLSSWSNNGTALGGVSSGEGYWGNGSVFDGVDDYIDISNSPSVNISGDKITVSAWIKTPVDWDTRLNGWEGIVYKGNFSKITSYALWRGEGANQWVNKTVGFFAAGQWIYSTVLQPNKWYSVSGTYNGTQLSLYIDGVLNESVINTGNINITNDSLRIGSNRLNYANEFYNGSIDEVMIWNRSLSAGEISALYNATASQYYNNFSNLAEGWHKFRGYAVDKVGNKNQTEERWVNLTGNHAPSDPAPVINSTDGSNMSSQDLHCSSTINDVDSNAMNVSVKWYNNSVEHLRVDYNNSYADGWLFDAVLSWENTTKGDNWSCGMQVFDGEFYSNWVNSSGNVTILNTPPVVTLVAPPNNALITDRTPTFNWSGFDADSDALTYEFNITLIGGGSSSCEDPRSIVTVGDENYTVSELQCFLDDNDYYNWSVRANDGDVFGSWTQEWRIEVGTFINISFVSGRGLVTFGSMLPGENNDTTDNSPLPFLLENSGNVFVNVSVANATDLWDSVPNPTDNYQFKIDNESTKPGSFDWGSSTTVFTALPNITPVTEIFAIGDFNYIDTSDWAEIDINITAPQNELPGPRSSTITFVARLAR